MAGFAPFEATAQGWSEEMARHAYSTPGFIFPQTKNKLIAIDSCSEDEWNAQQGAQMAQQQPAPDAPPPLDDGAIPQQVPAQEAPEALPPTQTMQEEEPDQPQKPLPTSTMLHEFAAMGNVAKMSKLLDKGMRVNVKDCLGETPLFWAVDGEVVEFLVTAGADLEWKSRFCGCTAFYKLATQGKHKPMKAIAKFLQKADLLGSMLSEVSSVTQRTALHSAAINGFTATVKELLALGADKDAQDYLGKTPLDLAKGRKWDDVVALLE